MTPHPPMPPTALGYATMIHGSGEGRILLALRQRGDAFIWHKGDNLASSPLCKLASVREAITYLLHTYKPFGVTLYPMRTTEERAHAIADDVLTPTTGALTDDEAAAYWDTHCPFCHARAQLIGDDVSGWQCEACAVERHAIRRGVPAHA